MLLQHFHARALYAVHGLAVAPLGRVARRKVLLADPGGLHQRDGLGHGDDGLRARGHSQRRRGQQRGQRCARGEVLLFHCTRRVSKGGALSHFFPPAQ
jgi:hypothetical protein